MAHFTVGRYEISTFPALHLRRVRSTVTRYTVSTSIIAPALRLPDICSPSTGPACDPFLSYSPAPATPTPANLWGVSKAPSTEDPRHNLRRSAPALFLRCAVTEHRLVLDSPSAEVGHDLRRKRKHGA